MFVWKEFDDKMKVFENKNAHLENKRMQERKNLASKIVNLGDTIKEDIENLKRYEVLLSVDVSNLETELKDVEDRSDWQPNWGNLVKNWKHCKKDDNDDKHETEEHQKRRSVITMIKDIVRCKNVLFSIQK